MNGLDEGPIGRLLGIAGGMVTKRFQQFLDSQGLTHAGWQVVQVLASGDGLTQREVAERCYVTSATVTGVVDTLERDGLVERERSTEDRRVVRVRLTKAGRKRLDATKRLAGEQMATVFGDLTPREETVLRRVLVRTIRRLGEEGTT